MFLELEKIMLVTTPKHIRAWALRSNSGYIYIQHLNGRPYLWRDKRYGRDEIETIKEEMIAEGFIIKHVY